MSPEEVTVGDGGEGTEPEMTEMLSRRREKNLVHWGADGACDLWWEAVEPNHPFPDLSLLYVLSSCCLESAPPSSPSF